MPSSEFKDPQFRSTVLGQEDFRIRPSEENKPQQEETPSLEGQAKDQAQEPEPEKVKKDTPEENNSSNKVPTQTDDKQQDKPKKENTLNKILRR